MNHRCPGLGTLGEQVRWREILGISIHMYLGLGKLGDGKSTFSMSFLALFPNLISKNKNIIAFSILYFFNLYVIIWWYQLKVLPLIVPFNVLSTFPSTFQSILPSTFPSMFASLVSNWAMPVHGQCTCKPWGKVDGKVDGTVVERLTESLREGLTESSRKGLTERLTERS